MAEHATVEYDVAPGNDYPQHEATYRGFLRLLQWTTGGIVLTLALLAFFLV